MLLTPKIRSDCIYIRLPHLLDETLSSAMVTLMNCVVYIVVGSALRSTLKNKELLAQDATCDVLTVYNSLRISLVVPLG